MRNARRWTTILVAAAVELGALYAWKFAGIEPAGNLLTFLIWVVFTLSLITFLMPRDTYPSTFLPRAKGTRTFGIAADLLLIVGLVWFGHFVLATAWLFVLLSALSFLSCYDAAGQRKPKEPKHA